MKGRGKRRGARKSGRMRPKGSVRRSPRKSKSARMYYIGGMQF